VLGIHLQVEGLRVTLQSNAWPVVIAMAGGIPGASVPDPLQQAYAWLKSGPPVAQSRPPGGLPDAIADAAGRRRPDLAVFRLAGSSGVATLSLDLCDAGLA